ncbi:MAG: DUF6516 family protein, partial [Thiohalorhabdus sp.]|uniref:toxin-antitoxin system TumE family protein n=1 Tax=Thiohalorhabdus sp. TaxID=3094134 RepID=UPI0039817FBE
METLLDLNGEMIRLNNGYSVKFEARQVSPNENLPHGIRYSLTLHDPNNKRVLGYDNAHAPNLDHQTVKKYRPLYQGRKIKEWDHKHNPSHPIVEPYVF